MIDGGAGWKTLFSRGLSLLIYKGLRLSKSHAQSFHYLRSQELVSHFQRIGVPCELVALHRNVPSGTPHLFWYASRIPDTVMGRIKALRLGR